MLMSHPFMGRKWREERMQCDWTRKAFRCCRSLNVKRFFVCVCVWVQGEMIVCIPLLACDNLDNNVHIQLIKL